MYYKVLTVEQLANNNSYYDEQLMVIYLLEQLATMAVT